MSITAPPAYAWDWLARQRVVWQEIRRHLSADGGRPDGTARGAGDVPDWASDHPDLQQRALASEPARPATDYRSLGTRAEVIAALRHDYPNHPEVRAVVDATVGRLAFLGRLDATLAELGVRTAPRGMCWWWSHLTGRRPLDGPSGASDHSEPAPTVPLQLRLVDVLAGYGDATGR